MTAVIEARVPQMTQVEFGLVAPAYNEASRGDYFKRFLDSGLSVISREFAPGEFRPLVVDDGSTDNTAGVAREMGWDVYSLPRHLGKSAAIKSGVREMGDVPRIAFADADGQYSPEDIIDLYRLTEQADVAVAKRSHYSSHSPWRSICHTGYTLVSRTIAPTGVSDPQAGAMAFRGRAIDLWKEVSTDRYIGPSEVLHNARKLGLRVVEKTVDINPADGSHVKPSDALKMLADLVRFRLST